MPLGSRPPLSWRILLVATVVALLLAACSGAAGTWLPPAAPESATATDNIGTSELRGRAAAMVDELQVAGEELMDALGAGDDAAVRAAAERLYEMTSVESEELYGLVAEACYTDAGAAYGMTVFNWHATAQHLIRFLDDGDANARTLAGDFGSDAIISTAEWRRLDELAC